MALLFVVCAFFCLYEVRGFPRPLLRQKLHRPLNAMKYMKPARSPFPAMQQDRAYSAVTVDEDGVKLQQSSQDSKSVSAEQRVMAKVSEGKKSENPSSDISDVVKRRVEQTLKQESAELDDAILKNYYTVAQTGVHTLDLGGQFLGDDVTKVLAHIKKAAFYQNVEHLILSRNQFKNVFDDLNSGALVDLPPNLKILDLSQNRLSGANFPWQELPPKLESLHLQGNMLTGHVTWRLLPKQLETLWIFSNQFKGIIQWNALPASLKSLGVSYKMGEESVSMENWKKDPIHLSDPIKTFLVRTDSVPCPFTMTNDTNPRYGPLMNMKIALLLFAFVIFSVPALIYWNNKQWVTINTQRK